MKIYVDAEYKCHMQNDGTMRENDAAFFDGKCQTFVEGYRFVPEGESWTRNDGMVFKGIMIAPWKDYAELAAAQREYEQQELANAQEVLRILLEGEGGAEE